MLISGPWAGVTPSGSWAGVTPSGPWEACTPYGPWEACTPYGPWEAYLGVPWEAYLGVPWEVYQAILHPGVYWAILHPGYIHPGIHSWVHPACYTPVLLHAEAGNEEPGVQRGSPGLRKERRAWVESLSDNKVDKCVRVDGRLRAELLRPH